MTDTPPDSDGEVIQNLLDRWEEARDRGHRLTAAEVCRDRPDMLAVGAETGEDDLVAISHYVLSHSDPAGPLGRLPRFDAASVGAARSLAG